MGYNEKKLKVHLWDAAYVFKVIILEKKAVSNVYRSWFVLVSSVFPLLTTLFSKKSEKSKNI